MEETHEKLAIPFSLPKDQLESPKYKAEVVTIIL
jgi:hypothetical protein